MIRKGVLYATLQTAMNDQSESSSGPESGKDMSNVRCPTCGGNSQPLIFIYYPKGVGDVRQVHDTIESLQQVWKVGATKTCPPENHGTCINGSSPSIAPPKSYVAVGNLGDEDRFTIDNTSSARNTSLVEFGQQSICSKDVSFLDSSQKIDLHHHIEENGIGTNDSLYEDFFNDSAFDSVFTVSETMNGTSMSERVDTAFSFNDEHIAASYSINNNQIPLDQVAPDLTPSIPNPVAAIQATVSLPISNISNRFQCTHSSCGADFNRISDLRRHQRTHGAPAHPCTVNGCVRRGPNAFHRRDKLLDHLRKKHGIAV